MLRVRTTISGWDGGPGLMTTYWLTPLEDAAAAARVVDYVQVSVAAFCADFAPTSVVWQVSGDVDVISAASGAITNTLSVTQPDPIAGGAGEGKAPTAVAALMRLSTNAFIAGRRLRGRIFISPLGAARVTSDGLLGDVPVAAISGFAVALNATLDAGDTWVVWHRPVGGAGGSAAPIVASAGTTKLAVLTSRRD